MIVTAIKSTTAMLLVALTTDVCLAGNPAVQAGRRVRRDAGTKDAEKPAEVTVTMFPDGVEHDFGNVERGTLARHTFRVVNTSSVPLRIIALRWT